MLSLFNFKSIKCSLLSWLIDGFNDKSDTIFIMRIFSVVSIQETNPLFSSVLLLYPKFHKFWELINIHKLNVINMSILLSFNNHTWRDALVTHSFWVRLMIFTSFVYFISYLRRGKTVATFYFSWMNSFAFKLSILKILIKW